MRRPVHTLLLCAALLCSGAAGLAVQPAATPRAMPDDLVTLAYEVEGEGQYRFEVQSPEGWTPLTRVRTLTLNGKQFVPVTLRVPRLAPAGLSPEIVVVVKQGEREVGRMVGRVEVGTRAKLQARGPTADMAVDMGAVNTFAVSITNLGNAPDTVSLESTHPTAQVEFSPSQLTLQPGESGVINVSVVPRGTYSPGYRYMLALHVRSSVNPDVKALVGVRQTYVTQDVQDPSNKAGKDPQIAFRVGLSAGANLLMEDGERTTELSYSVTPLISASLSDYVKGEVSAGTLGGSTAQPWPEFKGFGVQLAGPAWTLGMNMGQGGGSVQGDYLVGSWKMNSGVYLRRSGAGDWSGGLRTSARSKIGPGTLSANVQVSGQQLETGLAHQENFSVQYDWPLRPGLRLGLGAAVQGGTTETGYRASAAVTQALGWETQHFDLSQAYSGSTSGVHTISVSGGLRSIAPFGVRASAVAEFQPLGQTYRASVLGLWSPNRSLSFSVGGQYRTSTVPGTSQRWEVTAAGAYGYNLAGVQGSATARYAVSSEDGGPLRQTVAAAVSASKGGVTAAVRGDATFAVKEGVPSRAINLGLATGYQVGQRDRVGADYSLKWSPDGTFRQDLGVSWQRRWSETVNTTLRYQTSLRRSDSGTQSWPQAVSAQVGVRNAFGTRFAIGASYAVSSADGWRGPLTHRLGLQVGTQLEYAIDTPDAVVDFFGGREGGEVSGVAFLDSDLDGIFDPDERPLAGLTLNLGRESVLTAADGSYSVRLPTGSYQVRTSGGLSASLEALKNPKLNVTQNSKQVVNLPYTSINALLIEVFSDANLNGKRDPGEAALPYATVQLAGPLSREVFANGDGVLRLAGLPPGQYTVSLDRSKLPPRYDPTLDAQVVTVTEEGAPPSLLLAAGERPREQVTTFTAGSLAVLPRLSASTAKPGDTVTLTLRLQGEVQRVTVEAFGQTLEAAGEGSLRTVSLKVPADAAPGEQQIRIILKGASAERSSTVRLTVRAP